MRGQQQRAAAAAPMRLQLAAAAAVAAAVALAALLPLASAASQLEVGPGRCHPDCTKHGNCGDDGFCRCPYGRLGEACEINVLQPCQQFEDTNAYCGTSATKSCECMRRCKQYYCRKDSTGTERCEAWGAHPQRACYEREGVPPDEQYSRIPEEDEQGVTYKAWAEEGKTYTREDAMKELNGDIESLPLSKCPDKCNRHGYCSRWFKDPNSQPFCRCHRGYDGGACEIDNNVCYLKCNGRGKCLDQFCHCEPPYFSIGCSRSTTYPANHSHPSPIDFKIYMYELQTQVAYDMAYFAGWQQHDHNYIAYQKFLEQFLLSGVRTEDPSEANLFFIPSFTYSYSGNTGAGQEHLDMLLDHIKHSFPYWNRTGGRDHVIWTSADRGACHVGGLAWEPIKLTHFGMHTTKTNHYPAFGHLGHPEYGCYHPLKDVLAVPYDPRVIPFIQNTNKMSVEDHLAKKKKLFFFAGGVRKDQPYYSGGTRQILVDLVAEWKDPEFGFVEGFVTDYEAALREAKFCLAPFGYGYGMRLHQSVLSGCIPVIIAEHVYQPYEEIIPYETFSIRLSNEDLPHIREILRGVTDEQYREMLSSMLRYYHAFSWETQHGGRAFDYTIATLRRRHMNLKALYF